ncbi:hypothetical protein CVT25_002363 [Psilocybe cyanescens]|uniref:Uncharacterized protein n=1 Tax=Psilocybe cyanescens TaxID=93625 RepID=A0A409WKJ2_PSICY|nr:hypothetical protein CVT25_002363 [Psilocybe cyanescens]
MAPTALENESLIKLPKKSYLRWNHDRKQHISKKAYYPWDATQELQQYATESLNTAEGTEDKIRNEETEETLRGSLDPHRNEARQRGRLWEGEDRVTAASEQPRSTFLKKRFEGWGRVGISRANEVPLLFAVPERITVLQLHRD